MARQKNKTSPPRRLLYEQSILPSGKLSLSEQIHDILLRQIHAGRWKIGDRLPSISALAAESGLSRQPIQQAFDSLRAEGYVRSEQGNGTFLASVLPEGKSPIGAIGIVMFSH
ncbi:MAG: winged helix-turn-helix domain-containing protein, partial [Candidatus Sumerlaeota bacterium]|nr:winged helix-turn-helix domain-containing protein [Candidatus Sumerlaeota bacterium]